MRVLLTGSSGQVGSEFQRLQGGDWELTTLARAECDLGNEQSIREAVRRVRPDVIVNAGAYTAVDLAEKERDACFAVNAVAPRILAEEAASSGSLLIHFSTDYVFDGAKTEPYEEADPPAPLNVYGQSKLEGERGILAVCSRSAMAQALILRTSWVYAARGRNFLLTMLRLGKERPEIRVVNDQTGAPTSAKAIAKSTVRLIEAYGHSGVGTPTGVYHMTAAGSTSWHGLASEIFANAGELSGSPRVIGISTDEYPTPARRPRNSELSNAKFEKTFGFRLPSWQKSLAEVLHELRESPGVIEGVRKNS